jgi:hypothetical protein
MSDELELDEAGGTLLAPPELFMLELLELPLAGGFTLTEPLAEPLIEGLSVAELEDDAPGEAERSLVEELDEDAGGTARSVVERSAVEDEEDAPVPAPAPVVLLPRSWPHAASAAATAVTAHTLASIVNLCSMFETPRKKTGRERQPPAGEGSPAQAGYKAMRVPELRPFRRAPAQKPG